MSKHFRSFILLVLLSLLAGRVDAGTGSVTIAWDANSEPDVASYTVVWGTQPGTYPSTAVVGNATTWTVGSLVVGQTYYFAVRAVSADGLESPLSTELKATVAEVGPTGETQDEWMTRFGVTDINADDDSDGVSNLSEFQTGTDPHLSNTWYLAEGATGFFNSRLAVANPGTDTAEITVTFLREGTTPVVNRYAIAGLSRSTIDMNTVPGLENISASTVVTTDRGGVVVERTMTWGGSDNKNAGHTGKGVAKPSSSWYFAEGDAKLFDTYLLLANGNSSVVTVNVLYLLENGQKVRDSYEVAANSRRTVYTNNVPGIGKNPFSMTVEASAPIIAERSMYFNAQGQWWKGGHESAGAEQPSTEWFIAEGHTGELFSEYILLSNPNENAASTVTVRFLRPLGPAITKTYVLAPASRTTIFVNDVPGLSDTDVSAAITSTLPIIAERSMYWPGRYGKWYEGHNSLAINQLGTSWAVAEGEDGGTNNTISYVMVVNPTDTDAQVSMTVLREGLAPVVFQKTVAANSRLTVNSHELSLSQLNERFGMLVNSTNGVNIAVERSMYWDSAAGLHWAAGTCETATRIR
jgi:hypothetical protein